MPPGPFPPERREALLTLMDDPDRKVREAVRAEIERMGEGGLEFLRSAREHPEKDKAQAAAALLRELAGPDHEEEFIAYIRSGRYDIESGCLLLCRMERPKATPADFSLLEKMAAAARPWQPRNRQTEAPPQAISLVAASIASAWLPWKIWIRSLSPSTMRKCTLTVSPTSMSGSPVLSAV